MHSAHGGPVRGAKLLRRCAARHPQRCVVVWRRFLAAARGGARPLARGRPLPAGTRASRSARCARQHRPERGASVPTHRRQCPQGKSARSRGGKAAYCPLRRTAVRQRSVHSARAPRAGRRPAATGQFRGGKDADGSEPAADPARRAASRADPAFAPLQAGGPRTTARAACAVWRRHVRLRATYHIGQDLVFFPAGGLQTLRVRARRAPNIAGWSPRRAPNTTGWSPEGSKHCWLEPGRRAPNTTVVGESTRGRRGWRTSTARLCPGS